MSTENPYAMIVSLQRAKLTESQIEKLQQQAKEACPAGTPLVIGSDGLLLFQVVDTEDGHFAVNRLSFDGRTGGELALSFQVACFLSFCGAIAEAEELIEPVRNAAKTALTLMERDMVKELGKPVGWMDVPLTCPRCDKPVNMKDGHQCEGAVQ